MYKIEKTITGYIPKNTTCRFDEQKRQYVRDKEKAELMQHIEKVENPANISLSIDWVMQAPDVNTCRSCKEVIYGRQYGLQYTLNDELIQQDKPVVICEQCYFSL
jgi:hypothetical protein